MSELTIDRYPVQVYGHPPCATEILAAALNVTTEDARAGLRALFAAGFYVGPIEPTNSMLVAYCNALPTRPKKTWSVLGAIGKARRRWKAMAEAGNKVTMSLQGGERDAPEL